MRVQSTWEMSSTTWKLKEVIWFPFLFCLFFFFFFLFTWYLLLLFLSLHFVVVSILSFFFFIFFIFYLAWVNQTEWSMILACPNIFFFFFFFNKGNIKGTNSLKMCLVFAYKCKFCFIYICVWTAFVDLTWERVPHEKSSEMCICLWQSFDHLRLPSATDRLFKSSY